MLIKPLTISLAPMRGNLARLLTVFLCCAMVCGCSNQQLLGQGIVLTEEKVAQVDRTPDTKTGAKAGAGIGSAFGAIYGTALSIGCIAISLGTCAPATPLIIVEGMAMGAGIGGASGAAVGYAAGVYRQGKGLFQYSVKPLYDNTSPINIEQYSDSLMPEGTTVYIYRTTIKNTIKHHIKPVKPSGDRSDEVIQ